MINDRDLVQYRLASMMQLHCTIDITAVHEPHPHQTTVYTLSTDSITHSGRGAIILYKNGVTSPSYSSGIVRIYYSSTGLSTIRWGNICDDSSFSYNEASVICHQLGYTGVSTYGRAGSTSR